jgi:hypothetical protein
VIAPLIYPDYESEDLIVGGSQLTTNSNSTWCSEVAWSLVSYSGTEYGGGGGTITADPPISNRPSYQVGRGLNTTDTGRDLPDIALHAAGPSVAPAYEFYYAGKLQNTPTASSTYFGTSFSCPVAAGCLAIVEQWLIANGGLPANSSGKQRLGRINDTLYAFNGRSDVFHDITSGNNGYPATKYWDYASGWGSIDFYNLAVALLNPLAVVVTPQNPSISAGTTLPLSATVTGSNVQTVVWSMVSGPGSVNASTGLYTAPASVTAAQTAVVQAASTIDYAAPGATTGSVLSGQTTITIDPATFAVSGTVGLGNCVNLAQPITFTFRPAAGSNIVQTQTLGSNGSFSISGIPTGTYTIAIKGPKWLQQDLTSAVVSGNVSGLSASLLPGDINGDNVVNIEDFNLLAAAFGSDPSSANWNTDADLNCDGVVDIIDFSLLAENYGEAGDP